MSQSVRILYRDKGDEIAVRCIVPVKLYLSGTVWHLIAQDVDRGGKALAFAFSGIIAWDDARVGAILALKPLSDRAPPSPWRAIPSTYLPEQDHLVGAEDRHVLGTAYGPAGRYLMAINEFVRSLLPTKDLK